MHHGLLENIGIAIIAATAIGFIALRLRQPIIFGYLIAGALIGPEIGFKLVTDPTNIEIISEIGLILLLYIIGLEMNPHQIASSGKQLLLTGVGQFVLCVLLGLLTFPLFGYGLTGGNIDGLYLALLCALSSTAIVVKILYDKSEFDTLPGRLTLGVLIIQDIWAILVIVFQPNFLDPKISLIAIAGVKAAILLAAALLISRFVLWRVFEWISKTPEMVVAMSIGWCALVAGTAGYIGLSKEMGALIAGVAISTFPYSVHVTAQTLPLRDFFLTLFFISLGMKITAPELPMIMAALGIVLFIIISRFLTVYPLLVWSGAGRRTGFITSLNLAQISEFSLVIAALGITYGHIQKDMMSMLIYSMTFTSIISSYAIKYNHNIYLAFESLLCKMGFKPERAGNEEVEKHTYDIVLLGYHRGARSLIETVSKRSPALLKRMLVVDFNLEVLRELKQKGIAGIFGDISSVDTLKHAHIEHARIILSTIPDSLLKGTNNLELVETCRVVAPQAVIVAVADFSAQAEKLKLAGANEVVLPYSMIGEHLANFLDGSFKKERRFKEAAAS